MGSTSRIVLFILVFLTCLPASEISLCQLQIEKSNLLEIEVDRYGSATWTITNRYLLKTEDDFETFQLYLSSFEDKEEEYLESFLEDMFVMVNRASNITGRNMTAKDFNVNYGIVETPTESLGFIKYQCNWVGFALVEGSRIHIGDVFEAGFFLFENDELTVNYPTMFSIVEVSPAPDAASDYERALTWYGPQSFGAEEPRLLLEKETLGIVEVFQAYGPLIVVAVIGMSSGTLLFYTYKKRRKNKIEKEPPRITPELRSDEDKVVRLLKKMGGKVYQSTIGEKCGFSRSKTSQLLKDMEETGIIKRKKRGRQKIVILTPEKTDENP
jgi:predicted transcriptional regulator